MVRRMNAWILPNGNLLVPMRAVSDDGIVGDAMIEVSPDSDEGKAYAKEAIPHPSTLAAAADAERAAIRASLETALLAHISSKAFDKLQAKARKRLDEIDEMQFGTPASRSRDYPPTEDTPQLGLKGRQPRLQRRVL